MPTYTYKCDPCETRFDRILRMSEWGAPQTCETCGEVARKVVTGCNINFPGDDWASKNGRIKKQMAAKNERLKGKENEMKRDAPAMTLAPNVNGERVASWSDAQKLAKDQGKNTASYEPLVRKEKAATKT